MINQIDMKRILIVVALFAATGTMSTQAQYRQSQSVYVRNDGSVYRDNRGDYRWEIRERRVWIPEYRTAGIFGIGSRRVPGHYEMRAERVKIYLGGNNYRKSHPHGMPPGQRKKMNSRYDNRYDNRFDDRYDKHHKNKKGNKDRGRY